MRCPACNAENDKEGGHCVNCGQMVCGHEVIGSVGKWKPNACGAAAAAKLSAADCSGMHTVSGAHCVGMMHCVMGSVGNCRPSAAVSAPPHSLDGQIVRGQAVGGRVGKLARSASVWPAQFGQIVGSGGHLVGLGGQRVGWSGQSVARPGHCVG